MSFEDIDDTNEAHERRITRCRSCNARIIFLETASGKRMPCEADSVEPDDQEFDPKRHESHFAKCPKADQHRRPR
jgi:hypothetical protein